MESLQREMMGATTSGITMTVASLRGACHADPEKVNKFVPSPGFPKGQWK